MGMKVTSTTTIEVNSHYRDVVEVKVFDVKGILVQSFEQSLEKGVNPVTIQGKNWSAGSYYYVISGKKGRLSGEIIKAE